MNEAGNNWGITTDSGVSADAGQLVDSLSEHHRRLLDTWQGFTVAQWVHPSRNTEWTVHDTVRHVADVMVRVAAGMKGEPQRDDDPFDPRSTPDSWMVASQDESPAATVSRFAGASVTALAGISGRLASGDESQTRTLYGTGHWTVNVVHTLWDSWLHERDVLLALGRPAPSSQAEERLVGMYGLLMAVMPSMSSGQPLATTVRLDGISSRTIEVSCHGTSLRSAEVSGGDVAASGELAEAVDALAGRGAGVAEALPGAPAALGHLAAFFHS